MKRIKVKVPGIDMELIVPCWVNAPHPDLDDPDSEECRTYIEDVISVGLLVHFSLTGNSGSFEATDITGDEPSDECVVESQLIHHLSKISEVIAPSTTLRSRHKVIRECLRKLRSLPESTPNAGES